MRTTDNIHDDPSFLMPINDNNNNDNKNNHPLLKEMQRVNRTNLPSWLVEYIDWHDTEVASLNSTNWDTRRYLILRCTHDDRVCGGTADRLQSVPYFLRLGYLSKRIFLIRWNIPCRLEEFLIPNILNWTMPEFLEPPFVNNSVYAGGAKFFRTNAFNSKNTIVTGLVRSHFGGEDEFINLFHDFNETTPTYRDIYGDMFRMLFKPSEPVAKLIVDEMNRLDLFPGQYATAQYRAYYRYEDDKSKLPFREVLSHSKHAVDCAHKLLPNHPIYFSSDSNQAEDLAVEYGKTLNYSVVFQQNEADPLHLDADSRSNQTTPPEAFYDIFVDLWVMGSARCVTHGIGGFGRWATLLSFDPKCVARHSYANKFYDC